MAAAAGDDNFEHYHDHDRGFFYQGLFPSPFPATTTTTATATTTSTLPIPTAAPITTTPTPAPPYTPTPTCSTTAAAAAITVAGMPTLLDTEYHTCKRSGRTLLYFYCLH